VFDDMLKKPCLYHKTPINHTLNQCDMLNKYYSRVAANRPEHFSGRARFGSGGKKFCYFGPKKSCP
jgi:hypothetical protein